jgi:uncharacterized SAM-binding protein YcdF (DUF218 family)
VSQQADAIVVLGCRLRPGGTIGPALGRRLARGIELFQSGAAPRLVLSGGGTGPVPEASAMQAVVLAAGVPETAVLLEPRSADTLGNAREVARLLRAHGLDKVILVSCGYHLPRARFLFRAAGVRVAASAAAAAGSPARRTYDLAREGLAWLVNIPKAFRLLLAA